MADNYPELLTDLRTMLTDSLIAAGVEAGKAVAISHDATEKVRNDWGGAMVYIPKGMDFELSVRDQEIWHKFNGRNHRELCHEYDVSIQWLYKIIKYQRAQESKKRQADVFE